MFKKQLRRKPEKVPLRNVLLADKAAIYQEKTKGKYVLDGEALMYRVRWWKGMKFNEISEAYVGYVRINYGNADIDGYVEAISTKSNAHATRSKSKGSSQNVIVQEEN